MRLKCGYQVERGGWETLLSYYTPSEVGVFQPGDFQNRRNLHLKVLFHITHLKQNCMRPFFAYYHNYCFCQFSLSRQNINGSSEKKLRYCNLSIIIHRELRTFFLVSLGHWIKRLGTFLLHVQEFPVY